MHSDLIQNHIQKEQ
jgi:hypothetical protein